MATLCPENVLAERAFSGLEHIRKALLLLGVVSHVIAQLAVSLCGPLG